jgi:hypothetical protein
MIPECAEGNNETGEKGGPDLSVPPACCVGAICAVLKEEALE